MIKNVAMVGMGALGLLFGGKIAENLKEGHAAFVMDETGRSVTGMTATA